MTEQTTRPHERESLAALPIYATVLEASQEASRDLAASVGGDPAHAKLASDIRFMMVSGYLHARLVNRRYPWSPNAVLRPAFIELVLEAMASCLCDGPRTAPAPKPRKGRTAQKS
jgi:hypothetical protein